MTLAGEGDPSAQHPHPPHPLRLCAGREARIDSATEHAEDFQLRTMLDDLERAFSPPFFSLFCFFNSFAHNYQLFANRRFRVSRAELISRNRFKRSSISTITSITVNHSFGNVTTELANAITRGIIPSNSVLHIQFMLVPSAHPVCPRADHPDETGACNGCLWHIRRDIRRPLSAARYRQLYSVR